MSEKSLQTLSSFYPCFFLINRHVRITYIIEQNEKVLKDGSASQSVRQWAIECTECSDTNTFICSDMISLKA